MLRQPRSPAVVSLATAALREHCAAFGILSQEGTQARWATRKELLAAQDGWYHATAFFAEAAGKQKKKPKAKAKR